MIEQLFGSKTRVKLLQLFYSNPNRPFYVREITRKIDEQINSVRRELANLLSIGIISSETNNNRLYYEVNQKYEYYHPLAAIFGGASFSPAASTSTEEAADVPPELPPATTGADVKHPIQSVGNVELVIYTGQFTRDETSGVDILVVGDVNAAKLDKFVQELEQQESKELRYVNMLLDEFEYRRQINDRFLSILLAGKNQVVLDKQNLVTPAQTASPKKKNKKKAEKAEDEQ